MKSYLDKDTGQINQILDSVFEKLPKSVQDKKVLFEIEEPAVIKKINNDKNIKSKDTTSVDDEQKRSGKIGSVGMDTNIRTTNYPKTSTRKGAVKKRGTK
jgi:hypothetical protein